MPIYVISMIEWMYNDEYWYTSEDESGKPKFATADRKLAEKKLEELNARAFAGLDVSEYTYQDNLAVALTIPLGEANETLAKLGLPPITEDGWERYEIPTDLPLSKLKKIAKIFPSIRFYSLLEVERI